MKHEDKLGRKWGFVPHTAIRPMQIIASNPLDCLVNHDATKLTCYLIALTGANPCQAQLPRDQQRLTATGGSLP